jgi:dsDNA-specific endonuclease/ATPase MutS2
LQTLNVDQELPYTDRVDDTSIELPITEALDLHMFRPADVKDLVPTYLDECRKRGIFRVRIIHGKGIGALRETVHAILRRLPEVVTFGLAPDYLGGWGATVVELRAES